MTQLVLTQEVIAALLQDVNDAHQAAKDYKAAEPRSEAAEGYRAIYAIKRNLIKERLKEHELMGISACLGVDDLLRLSSVIAVGADGKPSNRFITELIEAMKS